MQAAEGAMDRRGLLYVVATPIGNLADLSGRACEVLAGVDRIAAEDTRQTAVLLRHYGLGTPLVAYHEHNEEAQAPRLVEALAAGERIALVSDAGTPLVSDPGYRLVRAARERGLRVEPVPGPSACIAALSAAGLPSDRFLFLGFPPRSHARRRAEFSALRNEPGTLVWYESGRRILATLGDLIQVLGAEREAVLARELTKVHETFLGATLADLRERLEHDPEQRLGEMVLLVAGARAEAADEAEVRRLLGLLLPELPLKKAVALTAEISGARRNRVYALALEMQG